MILIREADKVSHFFSFFPTYFLTIRLLLHHFVINILLRRLYTEHWKSLGMVHPPKEILNLSWTLPLLPADQFAKGCQVLTTLADPLDVEPHEQLNTFIHYLRRQWVPLANMVSIHGTPIRCNNIAEGFNSHAPFVGMLCVSSTTASIRERSD